MADDERKPFKRPFHGVQLRNGIMVAGIRALARHWNVDEEVSEERIRAWLQDNPHPDDARVSASHLVEVEKARRTDRVFLHKEGTVDKWWMRR